MPTFFQTAASLAHYLAKRRLRAVPLVMHFAPKNATDCHGAKMVRILTTRPCNAVQSLPPKPHKGQKGSPRTFFPSAFHSEKPLSALAPAQSPAPKLPTVGTMDYVRIPNTTFRRGADICAWPDRARLVYLTGQIDQSILARACRQLLARSPFATSRRHLDVREGHTVGRPVRRAAGRGTTFVNFDEGCGVQTTEGNDRQTPGAARLPLASPPRSCEKRR